MESTQKRRPIATRSKKWAQGLARFLAKNSVTPNMISVASGGVSLLGMLFLIGIKENYALILAALCIQLRLICNLMDGMVAIEHNKKTKSGDLFNEVPDRFADSFFIVGAGYFFQSELAITLAWLAALLSLMTAYLRVLGSSLGTAHYYSGPMAKQHRMFLLTVTFIAQAFTEHNLILGALILMNILLVVTIVNRQLKIYRELENK